MSDKFLKDLKKTLEYINNKLLRQIKKEKETVPLKKLLYIYNLIDDSLDIINEKNKV